MGRSFICLVIALVHARLGLVAATCIGTAAWLDAAASPLVELQSLGLGWFLLRVLD